jgi:hypothetical protein
MGYFSLVSDSLDFSGRFVDCGLKLLEDIIPCAFYIADRISCPMNYQQKSSVFGVSSNAAGRGGLPNVQASRGCRRNLPFCNSDLTE